MIDPIKLENLEIAVIGLGYVGLPLAIAFSQKFKVIGYDINQEHINSLKRGVDHSRQISTTELFNSKLSLTNFAGDISRCTVYIITVPTPVDEFKKPDIHYLLQASDTIGKYLKKGDIVIYESTVYPGCTEEDCVPALERSSGLTFNKNFCCGYSPERISPGDSMHTLKNIVKITSGSTEESADFIDWLYSEIIDAGTHKAPNIKIAEMAKAIENAQRDVNISFINEISLICDKVGIDTTDVIEAASTKWNFLKFKPGLVGGHCIGVDPYYLAYKAESLGHKPQVILSGRRVNDCMGAFIVTKIMKLMIDKGLPIKGSNALVLGFTFKENCPDIRNTKVIDIYQGLRQIGIQVDVCDPWANSEEIKKQFGFSLISDIFIKTYQAIILAVCHKEFDNIDYSILKKNRAVLFDTKSVVQRKWADGRL
jgi:UDP-N-acetyl-D-galactosamine dehydrogenase